MWFGKVKVNLRDNDQFEYVALHVTSAAEGNPDAIQLYDSCICSIGSAQWCSKYPNFVRMLLFVEKKCPGSLQKLKDHMGQIGAEFDEKHSCFLHNGLLVMTDQQRRDLFLAGGTGIEGSWTEEQLERAYNWVLAYANCPWEEEPVWQAQIDFAASTLHEYVRPEAEWLFQMTADPWILALRAAYISFAVNNPKKAAMQLNIARQKAPDSGLSEGTPSWVIEILRSITWDSGLDLWKHRYNAIRARLEKSFNVDLPDFADELRNAASLGEIMSPTEIQMALLKLKYDIGNSRVDGIIGRKTKAAIMEFQRRNGLPVDGDVDDETRKKLKMAIRLYFRRSMSGATLISCSLVQHSHARLKCSQN